MDISLALSAGIDIPFTQGQLTIHPPKICEIALMGEQDFYTALEILNQKKQNLTNLDKSVLEELTNFDIFMSIATNKDFIQESIAVSQLLSFLFPNYSIKYMKNSILLENEQEKKQISKQNFDEFQKIVRTMFCYEGGSSASQDYNPKSEMAKMIVEKLNKGRQKANKNKKPQQIHILQHYKEVLSVGLNKDINSFNNYTVYQLYKEYERYIKKYQWDMYIKAKLAGAQDLEDVDNWMDDSPKKGDKTPPKSI